MNLHWVDWAIVLSLVAFLLLTAQFTKRYMRGVSDFLAADRCGGRYLICISSGGAELGAVTIVALWQLYTNSGFTGLWWKVAEWPLVFILAMSGWVLYRYRQTRALTMAQFLEMRYSRRFRVFTGFVAFAAGLVNYGVFPSINARLIIYFCGLPEHLSLWGRSIGTFPLVMLVLLGLALFFTFAGGQITIMLTDFVQGICCLVVFLISALVLYHLIGWETIGTSLAAASQPQASLLNPFSTIKIKGFSIGFFLVQYFRWVYHWKAWQGTQGFNAAARTPHEARMSGILGQWRFIAQQMLIPIFAVCVLAALNSPQFADSVGDAKQVLSGIDTDRVKSELTVPLVLARLLPVGLMGAMTAVLLAAAVATDQAYLHSWGSIFIQDVVLPLRKRPLAPQQHIRCLRLAILGVAAFAFWFSLVFRDLGDYVLMFFAATGAIYLGGAGCCIISGLYTRRGTTAGAWGAMITGVVLGSIWLIANRVAIADAGAGGMMFRLQSVLYESPAIEWLVNTIGQGDRKYLDGQWMCLYISLAAIAVYWILSLLLPGKPFDLDKMLHRGPYAVVEDVVQGDAAVSGIWKWLGVNKEFTRGDKAIYGASVIWVLAWGGIFIAGAVYHFGIRETTDTSWLGFWKILVWLALGLGVAVTVWFLIGGLRDLRDMFHLLGTKVRDESDDGRVRP
ncbi:MAG: sodium:solute symporter family protein [Phycisphaerae bacterium]